MYVVLYIFQRLSVGQVGVLAGQFWPQDLMFDTPDINAYIVCVPSVSATLFLVFQTLVTLSRIYSMYEQFVIYTCIVEIVMMFHQHQNLLILVLINWLPCVLLYFIFKISFSLFDFKTVSSFPNHGLVGGAVKVTREELFYMSSDPCILAPSHQCELYFFITLMIYRCFTLSLFFFLNRVCMCLRKRRVWLGCRLSYISSFPFNIHWQYTTSTRGRWVLEMYFTTVQKVGQGK